MINLTYSEWQEDVFHNWRDGIRFKIIPKGRRVGGTKGAANACIDYCLQSETQILWGDTIRTNIDRYYERYFYPELRDNKINFKYLSQEKKLIINNSVIDFRGADIPENWEGFGYKMIILNEAGIILKNPRLYTSTVLPMLIDHPDSKLIAIGTPKGKYLKSGVNHPFYELYQNGINGISGYESKTITSYESPFLSPENIAMLEQDISLLGEQYVRQEIYGEFVEVSGNNPFMTSYNEERHIVDGVEVDTNKIMYVSMDFNINPFAVIFANIWRDANGVNINIFDEASIVNGSIDDMIKTILKYRNQIPSCRITGDYMGRRRQQSLPDLASYYTQIQRGLNISINQIVTLPNPSHENSRADCNFALHNFNIRISPRCKLLNRDMKIVQADINGKIEKRDRSNIAQQADMVDAFRYLINTFCYQFIKEYQKNIIFAK